MTKKIRFPFYSPFFWAIKLNVQEATQLFWMHPKLLCSTTPFTQMGSGKLKERIRNKCKRTVIASQLNIVTLCTCSTFDFPFTNTLGLALLMDYFFRYVVGMVPPVATTVPVAVLFIICTPICHSI